MKVTIHCFASGASPLFVTELQLQCLLVGPIRLGFGQNTLKFSPLQIFFIDFSLSFQI
jgi:hypothetical protein